MSKKKSTEKFFFNLPSPLRNFNHDSLCTAASHPYPLPEKKQIGSALSSFLFLRMGVGGGKRLYKGYYYSLYHS